MFFEQQVEHVLTFCMYWNAIGMCIQGVGGHVQGSRPERVALEGVDLCRGLP